MGHWRTKKEIPKEDPVRPGERESGICNDARKRVSEGTGPGGPKTSLLQWPYCTLHILRSNQRGEIIQRSKQYCIHREVPSVQAPKIGKRRGSNPRHKDRLCVSRGWIGRANHIQTFNFPQSDERPLSSLLFSSVLAPRRQTSLNNIASVARPR